MCTLELAEARKGRSVAIFGDGAAEPLVISLEGGPSSDRAIRGGAVIALRGVSAVGQERMQPTDGVSMAIEPVAGPGDARDWIHDGSLVRLTAPPDVIAAGRGAGAGRGQNGESAPQPEPMIIFKADRPTPNRPTTCDGRLRDGDFVFLQAITPRRWIDLRSGALVARSDYAPAEADCRQPRELCYTDRYGALLCVNYFTCANEPKR
jgi:hypothetical protein